MHRISPLHPSALLLAFALLFAAAPARAQESALFAPAATALPALLQPAAKAGHDARVAASADIARATLVGAAVGCAVFGLSIVNEEEASMGTGALSRFAIGCGFGAFIGGFFGFTFALFPDLMEGR